MGYVLRVRMASFFAGAATASFIGLYVLYKDYKVANESISHQVCNRFRFLFYRIGSISLGSLLGE